MVDSIRHTVDQDTVARAPAQAYPPVSAERQEKFSKAMVAAALQPPQVSLTGANGDGDDDHVDPPTIPMKAPVLPPISGR